MTLDPPHAATKKLTLPAPERQTYLVELSREQALSLIIHGGEQLVARVRGPEADTLCAAIAQIQLVLRRRGMPSDESADALSYGS